MNNSNSDIQEAFSLLDKLGDLSEADIEDYFSPRNVKLLALLASKLLDQHILSEVSSPDLFSKSILLLRRIKRDWGVRLGNAIYRG